MEPNSSSNTNSSPHYPQPPVPDTMHHPKKRWPFSRKKTILAGVAAAVVVLIVVGFVLNKKSSSGGDSQDKASIYIKQPGYENVSSGIGDPLALISKPDGPIARYGDSNVIQACSVLTIKDVRDAGLKTAANQLPGAVTRVFFDGLSTTPLKKPSDFFLPFDDDSNRCTYYLENKGLVKVSVYQPSYASKQAVDFELGRGYSALPDINGLKVYQDKADAQNPDVSSYIVRGTGADAQLSVTTSDKNAKSSLLNVLVKRLNEGSEGTPIQIFSFNSPIFRGKTAEPCLLVDNDDFKKILQIDAGPLVEESLPTAIGVIQDHSTSKLYNYAAHNCKRRSPEGSTKDQTLNINVVTYETEEGAKVATAFERSPESLAKDLKEVTPAIGDESYFASTAGLDNALVFRKGRAVVHMAFFLPRNNNAVTDDQRIQAMTPVAKEIANDRLKDF